MAKRSSISALLEIYSAINFETASLKFFKWFDSAPIYRQRTQLRNSFRNYFWSNPSSRVLNHVDGMFVALDPYEEGLSDI